MERLTIAQALREGIREEMRRDERVFCIGEDIGVTKGFGGAFTVTLGLSDEFGHERILDTPISETGLVGAAIGAAMMGLRPIADVQYSDFLFCAMDQVINQAPKMRYMSGGKITVPMVLRAPVGATQRGAQHAQSVESYFFHCPGWKIACPSNAYDAKGLLKTAVRDDNPVFIFEHKKLYGAKGIRKVSGSIDASSDIPAEEYLIPFGQAKILREGKDVTILATLRMVYESLRAAEELASKKGISAEVIDPRTLIPFDYDTLYLSVKKTGRLVIVHEDTMTGGWGAEIAARVSADIFDCLDAPVTRVCAPDTPAPFSTPLEEFFVPDKEKIKEAVLKKA
ncbi:MAG: alpha-ketoacid dehydrogenase subunit beta [Candidatus Omnitrophica bacterium]|nr:alpha-ketoacid dehydrogenase subunit beta [Candidatus Omnitrophota bacterium]